MVCSGDYKRLANEVGGEETAQPKEVHRCMRTILAEYNDIEKVELTDILNFHVLFERIHPFKMATDV